MLRKSLLIAVVCFLVLFMVLAGGAVYWWCKAVNQGFAPLQSLLNMCCADGGNGGPGIWTAGKSGQEKGQADFNEGLRYFHGNGVAKDFKEAVKCWSRAAE